MLEVMDVLIAVDSFKGTLTSEEVASSIATGWRSVRPEDTIDLLPLADGGEGTAEVIAGVVSGSIRHHVNNVTGPDGQKTRGEWFQLPGDIGVFDLAQMSGLPLMSDLAPLTATTRGLGETIRVALDQGITEIWIGLGGSASTDGGLGALRALGLRAADDKGNEIKEGGLSLIDLKQLFSDDLRSIPDGVTLLSDVTSPLLGPDGAATIFAPQKGASPEQVEILERALRNYEDVLEVDSEFPGAGAAGGTGYGFKAVYGAEIVSGAQKIAQLVRLHKRIAAADLVITGEGAFDHQSLRGKLVGNVLQASAKTGAQRAVIAGVISEDPGVPHVSLVNVAGDTAAAKRDPAHWTAQAAARIAENTVPAQ